MKRLNIHMLTLRRRYLLAAVIFIILIAIFGASVAHAQFRIDIPLSSLKPEKLPPPELTQGSSFEEFHEELTSVYHSFLFQKTVMNAKYWEMKNAALNQAVTAALFDSHFNSIDQRYFINLWSEAIRRRDVVAFRRIEQLQRFRSFVQSVYYREYKHFEARLYQAYQLCTAQHFTEYTSLKTAAFKQSYSPSR